VIRAWPVGVCEYVTLQVPLASVQDAVGVKVPVELDVKLTVPVGVIAPVPDESVTVAVHVVDAPELMEAGLHVTVVVVDRIVDASVNVPVLAECTESPP
jgi:hypothetical protein